MKIKIILIVYLLVVILGFFQTGIMLYHSSKTITKQNAIANLNVVKQVNSSIEIIKKDLSDATILLCLDVRYNTVESPKKREDDIAERIKKKLRTT